MMFSATFPKEAREAGKKLAALDHVFIKVGRTGSTTMNIKQQVSTESQPRW
jgi:superfamily II DNA/RNA helicase